MRKSSNIKKEKIVIIGAGPAGLAVAWEIVKKDKEKNFDIEIIESDKQIGGLSKTIIYKGYRFDLGGHRFYTKISEIDKFYKKILGKNMLERKRLSRIYYDHKFYNYPLSAINALKNLGLKRSISVILSYLKCHFNKYKNESTFDKWIINRFGEELFNIFFKSYSEKLWGISTSKLSSDWGAQRIQNFNLFVAIINAIFKINPGSKTIIDKFHYPKYGPGMLYEKMVEEVKKHGVSIKMLCEFTNFVFKKDIPIGICYKHKITGRKRVARFDHLVSTMPLNKLILSLNPPPNIKKLILDLKYRTFITIGLLIKNNPFPDQWIYIHDPDVRVGRIQNYRNWSKFMVKKGGKYTPIGMEYFASEKDDLWEMKDKELVSLAKQEILKIGLCQEKDIVDGFVCRVKDAYPVYNVNYKKPLGLSNNFLRDFKNIHPCGRGGLFRYNNMDHSILTGFYVARNIFSNDKVFDVWSVNEQNNELSYLEKK